jgi:3-oxoacyl-[acyl-carrier protein] reductase
MSQRTVIVTGGARSIGAAIAEALAADATGVLVHYHGRHDEAEEVADRIRARGADAITAQADLREPGAAEHLMDTAVDRWGRVDVVVANAGAPNPGVDVMHGTDEAFAEVLDVNTRAVYAVLRAAASRLADGGRLINIGSSSTLYPTPARALYSASKAGPLVLTTALATALAPRRATANSVIAGPIDDGFLAGRDARQLADLAALSPFGRLGTAADIAGVVAFIASDAARWITGQQILVNGGALG